MSDCSNDGNDSRSRPEPPPVLDYERPPRPAKQPVDWLSAAGACGLLAALYALMAVLMAMSSFAPVAIMAGGLAIALGAIGLMVTLIAGCLGRAHQRRRLFIATIVMNAIPIVVAAAAMGLALHLR